LRKGSRKIVLIVTALAALVATGTVGYMLLLNVSFIDALYMTVITLSTVGFREVVELDSITKVFTIFIIFGGLSTAAYTFTNVASFILEGEFGDILRRRKMENKISDLKDHYILCGAGQTGTSVITRFQRSNESSLLVIEKDEEKVDDLIERGILALHGDATQEDVLEKAGICLSKGLISCLATDADNVFTVLTARGMNPDLHIISRAINKNAHAKLRRAGANNTISPNELGGTRMASLLLRPAVVSFLDIITHMGDVVLDLEEVSISPDSTLSGITLKEARIPERTGLNVLAIKRKDQEKLLLNPTFMESILPNDKLLVLGQIEQIEKLRVMAQIEKVGSR
jgi:voltage-gated potassium channel